MVNPKARTNRKIPAIPVCGGVSVTAWIRNALDDKKSSTRRLKPGGAKGILAIKTFRIILNQNGRIVKWTHLISKTTSPLQGPAPAIPANV